MGNQENVELQYVDEYGNPISYDETGNVNISSGEANLANNGDPGIYLKNGRIYFGKNVSTSSTNAVDIKGSNTVDNDLVDCAKDGTTLGQFLHSILKVNVGGKIYYSDWERENINHLMVKRLKEILNFFIKKLLLQLVFAEGEILKLEINYLLFQRFSFLNMH